MAKIARRQQFYDAEVLAWVNISDPIATGGAVPTALLEDRVFVIPANQKNRSWVPTMRRFAEVTGASFAISERYCDSLEDFLMTRVSGNELFLCSPTVAEMPAITMRGDRVVVPFEPRVALDWSMAYADRPDDETLRAFVSFLYEKGRETRGTA